jgi:hypothetical protein
MTISAIYEDCRVTSMIQKLQNVWKRVDHIVQEIMVTTMIDVAPLVEWHYCCNMLMLKQKMMMKLR